MKFSITQENYTISAKVEIVGKDLFIEVTGGDNPHIGTVTTLTKDIEMQTVRFPSHDGRFHKDDVLATRIGKIIQADLPGSCTITTGVHVNHISKKQIFASDEMAKNLGLQIRTWLRQTSFARPEPVYYSDSENPQ